MEITRLSTASWFKIKSGSKIIHFDPGYAGYFKNQHISSSELEEKADLILIRAKADAELAVSLAREQSAKVDLQNAQNAMQGAPQ